MNGTDGIHTEQLFPLPSKNQFPDIPLFSRVPPIRHNNASVFEALQKASLLALSQFKREALQWDPTRLSGFKVRKGQERPMNPSEDKKGVAGDGVGGDIVNLSAKSAASYSPQNSEPFPQFSRGAVCLDPFPLNPDAPNPLHVTHFVPHPRTQRAQRAQGRGIQRTNSPDRGKREFKRCAFGDVTAMRASRCRQGQFDMLAVFCLFFLANVDAASRYVLLFKSAARGIQDRCCYSEETSGFIYHSSLSLRSESVNPVSYAPSKSPASSSPLVHQQRRFCGSFYLDLVPSKADCIGFFSGTSCHANIPVFYGSNNGNCVLTKFNFVTTPIPKDISISSTRMTRESRTQ